MFDYAIVDASDCSNALDWGVAEVQEAVEHLAPGVPVMIAMDGPIRLAAADHTRRRAYVSGAAPLCLSGTMRARELHLALRRVFELVMGPDIPGDALTKMMRYASELPPRRSASHGAQRVALVCAGADQEAALRHATTLFRATARHTHELHVVRAVDGGYLPVVPPPPKFTASADGLASYVLLRVLAEGSAVVPALPGLCAARLDAMEAAYARVVAQLSCHAVVVATGRIELRTVFMQHLLRALAGLVEAEHNDVNSSNNDIACGTSGFWRREYYRNAFGGNHRHDFVHDLSVRYRRGLVVLLNDFYLAWHDDWVATKLAERARYPHANAPLPHDLQCVFADDSETEAVHDEWPPDRKQEVTPTQVLAYVLPQRHHEAMLPPGPPRVPEHAAYMFPTAFVTDRTGRPRLPVGDPLVLIDPKPPSVA
jgi:hypothetical protein